MDLGTVAAVAVGSEQRLDILGELDSSRPLGRQWPSEEGDSNEDARKAGVWSGCYENKTARPWASVRLLTRAVPCWRTGVFIIAGERPPLISSSLQHRKRLHHDVLLRKGWNRLAVD
jgi:hypothetical protein